MVRPLGLSSLLLSLAAVVVTEPGFAQKSASAEMHVSATVVARAVLNIESAPDFVDISSEDARRGYVELKPLKLRVRTNDPLGYRIEFDVPDQMIRSLEVQGPERETVVIRTAGWIARRFLSAQPSASSYKLQARLVPGTIPGRYPLQLGISVQPISSGF